MAIAYSSDGTQIISGSQDQTVIIWDLNTHAAKNEPLRGHSNSVTSVAYSLDDTYIISGSEDHTIIIWDPIIGAACQEPLKGHEGGILSIACSPSRFHVASGSRDKTIWVWDLQTGKPIYKPLKGHIIGVSAIVYSLDGNFIISGSPDTTVRIWDSLTGAPLCIPLSGHNNMIKDIALSSDMRHIASCADNTIRVWDIQTGIPIKHPLRSQSSFIQAYINSDFAKSEFTNKSWRYIDFYEHKEGLPSNSFWDPNEKSFISTQYKQPNASQDGPDHSMKDIEVLHSPHPLAIVSDGWLHTVDGGLFIYVPHEYWTSICDTSTICIPDDAQGHPIRLNWDRVYNAWDNIRKMM